MRSLEQSLNAAFQKLRMHCCRARCQIRGHLATKLPLLPVPAGQTLENRKAFLGIGGALGRRMASFAGVHLHHVARETTNVERLVKFYQEVFGFEKIETPDFGFQVVWLKLPPSYSLHIIQRDVKTCLPESPYSAVEHARKEETALPNGHHLCFSITDYPGAIQVLKEKKIPYYEKFLLGGKVKQVFFFDPDGNGLELADWPPETHSLGC